ncbi:acyl-CoA-binding domain-containing protein 5 [Onthophagus taurus]|uniref:acyl-CoA-binding domain-containing protein 5 n=1 Tax=Onthophagus taurus TaxID=166361 RepID=UPI000C20CBCB|nr:acyl-CoA-binding domain-containing protein 5 [Onthophagus taurus]
MTTEEKFNAAVNVIKSLPKNGSYQPSHDLMLRFYSYYKQATLGPCTGGRPAFWDVVGRAKYDAWKALGDLPKTDAMKRYVDELHSIVETMSYSDKVASFLNAPSSNIADLELIAGDVIQRVRSRSNSPQDSPNPSPVEMNGHNDSWSESPFPSESDTDHSDGDYLDTIEAPEPRKLIPNGHHIPLTNGYPQNKDHSKPKKQRKPSVDISQEIAKAVQSLKSDIEALKGKVMAVETAQTAAMVSATKRKNWWQEVSPQLLTFIIIWPFVASLMLSRFLVKRST